MYMVHTLFRDKTRIYDSRDTCTTSDVVGATLRTRTGRISKNPYIGITLNFRNRITYRLPARGRLTHLYIRSFKVFNQPSTHSYLPVLTWTGQSKTSVDWSIEGKLCGQLSG